ncbi:MAG TPA: exodeoxyribonuclease III [Dongiaceae bacterium]|nr:exodeoxyribonuclease III [Dongiaceae bacterium]
MKVVSFNANGIRARLHQIEALLAQHAPDVIGIQETKVEDGTFPLADLQSLGLHVEFFGQKSHYGVALLSRQPPVNVHKGFNGGDDLQKRLIRADYALPKGGTVTIFNGYFPQGESRDHPEKFPNKERYYRELRQLLLEQFQPSQNLIVMGDMNVAPLDNDIGIGADNAKRWLREGKCCFLPEEREWLSNLMQWGLQDTYRLLHPEVDDRFSWFDYRSKGFEREPRRGLRIDMILGTASMTSKLKEAGICYEIRSMKSPSDHCPVWAEFAF